MKRHRESAALYVESLGEAPRTYSADTSKLGERCAIVGAGQCTNDHDSLRGEMKFLLTEQAKQTFDMKYLKRYFIIEVCVSDQSSAQLLLQPIRGQDSRECKKL